MSSTRTYGDACAAAHALDLVGERWALLVVRELLLGPKRFSDLRSGLPNVGPNRLSQRLSELEQSGIVRRRKLGPPARSWVYELTDWGRQLQPVLVHLGRWGRLSPFRDLDADISVDALMLALQGDFDPEASRGLSATYTLIFGDDHVTVRVTADAIAITRGDLDAPDATIATDPRTFATVLTRKRDLQDAVHAGDIAVSGDVSAIERLLEVFPRPETAEKPPE
ncbi:winged helix-turn-helix transcriptional regulator [Nonomuraea sp. 3-1Str]|uniref:winged helix-turn-helix transcriptional regulator n=1 Tax=Nonomuraea sp. 3-1Str TaxID=2929801 RepID=UPI002857A081|nr:winged helix-turn-helix transcriptional regulator [Nonomuraea sp. 3-1Str]MDR8408028.1 winged helix-turn-helix transcriptional regulator [Nonomuraea sp. 3-1Str]